jgi:D-alanyl-D-alanine carboxypeptidase (penicillin-binding protein 5/6)
VPSLGALAALAALAAPPAGQAGGTAGAAPPDGVPGAAAPEIAAASAVVVDAHTGQVLYAKNPDDVRPVASTQKLLTALMVVERGGLDETVEVDASDADVPQTRVGIKPGDSYPRRQLLTALLVKSGNDLAHCLARDYAGSEAAFAELMTRRASLLGMEHSVFKNASGLPADGQRSSARDLAKLARAAYYNPTVRKLAGLEEFTFVFNDGRTLPVSNTNRLLRTTEYCDGMKTGFTNAAQHCLVSSATRGSRSVIAVVLGAPSRSSLWDDSEALLDWALRPPEARRGS